MASVQLNGTTTSYNGITHGRNIERAGSRLYVLYNDDGTLTYEYSDNDGATWTGATQVSAADVFGSLCYDAVNARMNIVYAGGNNANASLRFRAITSNVATGTPGALTTETVIDAAGTNLGVNYPYLIHSATGTNPRYWVIANKHTSASVTETRAWRVTAGSAADTAGNWATTNFTNLGANTPTNTGRQQGAGAWWTVAGADKVTFVFGVGNEPLSYEAVTFDPTAATPTPGTVTGFGAIGSGGGLDQLQHGTPIAINAKADYLVFGRFDPSVNTWTFYKTVNGTSWAIPTGWGSLTMGRCQIALSSGDFYLAHTASYGVLATSAQPLQYRKLTAVGDNMGGVTAFSDRNANGISVPRDTGTLKLYAIYRAGSASPYIVYTDNVNIGGAADTTPPGQATISTTAISGTQIDVAMVMPADIDVAYYQLRGIVGATPPLADRSNGSALSEGSTTANASVTYNHTSVTSSQQWSYRVFVQDTAGNWNTGALATAVAITTPAFIGRFKIDGTTAVADGLTPGTDILVWQLSTSNFLTGGANAHAELQVGSLSGTPPTGTSYSILSTAGTSVWQYENAALVWTNWPTAGLPSTDWARRIRCNVDTNQSSQFGSLRVKNG